MAMPNYTITAYCPDCGRDLAEIDAESLEEAVDLIEYRADFQYQEHIKNSRCQL